jgi:hypothetical protein
MNVPYQPAEARTFTDPATGATVRQVTAHPSLHHHPFYYLPAYDDAMARLFFLSHRTGRPEIWCELRATGELQQLTDHPAWWVVGPATMAATRTSPTRRRLAGGPASGAEESLPFAAVVGGRR